MLARVSESSKRIVLISVASLLAIGAVFYLYVARQARTAIGDGARIAAASNRAAASVLRLRSIASRFAPVLSPADFESAVEFNGDLYVCGSSALFKYSQGILKQTWAAGRELPPTRLLTLAVRMGIGNPELWIATGGAGILIYDGGTFHQLLPEEPELRKISALLPLANGRVLVGTPERGLFSSDGKSLQLFHSQLSKVEVTALGGDENQFWVGTRGETAHGFGAAAKRNTLLETCPIGRFFRWRQTERMPG